MSEKLLCLECGKELPEVGAISGYCSKSCYQKAYRNKKKSNSDKAKELVEEMPSIIESIKGGLGQAIEMEAKEELLGMVVTKQKEKSDDLWQAVRLLHNQKANIQDLINQSENNMKAEEVRLSDIQHKIFRCVFFQ